MRLKIVNLYTKKVVLVVLICYIYFFTTWTLSISQLKDDGKITQSKLNGRTMPSVTFSDLSVD